MDSLGDSAVHTRSILRPHGVFAVISPFNFPMALAAGPSAAAMLAGNTVVFKPSSAAPISGVKLVEAYREAGVPDGVINLVMGPGETVGAELRENPGIDGIVFTGSYAVGMDLYRTFSKDYPKPTIVEMGGKNPAVVSRNADLDEAAEGIMRSAFGFGGQKCSANSRVYVEKPVHDELVKLLVEKTEAITIGDPLLRENWLGPVIDQKAVDRHQAAVGRGASRRAGVHRRRAPHRIAAWIAGSTSSRRSSATCRPTTACSATSCSRRSPRSRPSTRFDEALAPRERHRSTA